MHYLIFIPNKSAANRQHLIDAGLGDLLREGDESPVCTDLIGRGPGDLPGQIWSWGNANPFYLPEQQNWVADKQGRYWFGVTTANPPTPLDISRKVQMSGTAVTLENGQEWLIPNVTRLPAVFDIDENDEPIRVPHPKFKIFTDACGSMLGEVLDNIDGGPMPDWKRSLDFAVMALGLNYRINRSVAIRLGCLSVNDVIQVVMRSLDVGRIRSVMEDLKKKDVVLTETGLEPSSGEKV